MSDAWTGLLAARARVAAADERLQARVGALRHRLAPATLAAEGRGVLRAKGREVSASARTTALNGAQAMAENPARTAIVAAALVAFLARRRIADAIARVTSSEPKQERTNRGRSRN